MPKLKNKYIELDKNFNFIWNFAVNNKNAFDKISNFLETNIKIPVIKKDSKNKTVSVQFKKKEEK